MLQSNDSRRGFLKKTVIAGSAASLPSLLSTAPATASATASKNDRIPIGLIGAGGMANGNMRAAKEWVDVVAIADVDESRQQSTNQSLSGGKADCYSDYREILERDDIKVVHIATPDHWHTKPLVEAMLAGKDIYCEKPMTLTIDEGKLIRKIQKQTGRIVQVGTQQRSTFQLFTKAIAMVNEGRIGTIRRIQCAIGGAPTSEAIPGVDAPKSLDWDRWLGPAPQVDYRYLESRRGEPGKERTTVNTNCHYEFRWWYEYSGGKLTDWGAHHVDIAVWALKVNGQTEGPISIGGTAEHPVVFEDGVPTQNDRYNTATKFNLVAKYANGVELVIRNDTDNGILIEGDKGRIFVNRNKLVGKPVEELVDHPLDENAIKAVYKNLPIAYNERKAHWANFLYCHREQIEPISDVHSHMDMLNICHLAGISARLGRTLKWDSQAEEIVGDDQANQFLARPYRDGYAIEM